MKTGIYGGTFSPPHIGHYLAARAFLEAFALDELLIIPALVPPHKQINYEDDPVSRLEMCEIAFSGLPDTTVSDLEISRGGKSYTVMTLRELTRKGRELYFLCGTDMMLTIDEWYCPEEIFRLAHIVCMRRESDTENTEKLENKMKLYRERFGASVSLIDAPSFELSSSEVREAIKEGRDTEGMLQREVDEYIRKKGLYL